MNWLLIDTCCQRALVALAQGDKVVAVRYLGETKKHSELLAPAVKEIMAEAGLEMVDLDGVAAGKGPGSFIGSRIGIAYAKGVCVALDIPLWGVGTLSAFASDPALPSGRGVALIDARRGEFYVQTFERNPSGETKALDAAHLVAADQIEALKSAFSFAAQGEGPSAEGLLRAFLSLEERRDERDTLVPDYVRDPDAKPLEPIKNSAR